MNTQMKQLRRRLGTSGPVARTFNKLLAPDRIRQAVPELGALVRARDEYAIEELRLILERNLPSKDESRKSPVDSVLIDEISKNEDLRGILELYRERTGKSKSKFMKRKIFDGVMDSLVHNQTELDLSKLSGREKEFAESFFERPLVKKGEIGFFKSRQLRFELAREVDSLMDNVPVISNELMDLFYTLAENYLSFGMKYRESEHDFCSDMFIVVMQLDAIIHSPKLLGDERIDGILMMLNGCRDCPIPAFDAFRMWAPDGKGGEKRYVREGLGKDFIQAAERLSTKDFLYNGPFGTFMCHVARVVNTLSNEYSEETLGVRLKMLEMYMVSGNNLSSVIRPHICKSFRSEADRQALEEIVDGKRYVPPKVREEAQLILNGRYDNVLFFA